MTKSQMQALIDSAVTEAIAEYALRVDAILRSPEAEGRRDLAMTLALNSTLSADAAIQMLKAAPKANAHRDAFLQAMNREGRLDLAPEHTPVAEDRKAKRLAEIKAAGAAVNAARNGARARA